MGFEYDFKTEKYTCCKCSSNDVTESIIKDFADTERDIYNEEGDVIRTVISSFDATVIDCNNCKNSEILD